ncbi:MAG: TIR domain-containing protein [Acidobacteria bacterium]|nr:TIR domain-containing protein [Acidobacteriota bacterium]
MSDVFVSYVEEDAQVAVDIAAGLEQAGYTTWCYTRNSLPAIPYLTQVLKAIEQAQAILLLISPESVKKSNQVNIEVVRGLESRKQFIPILLNNIRWDEFKRLQPEWALAMGGAVGVPATPATVPQLVPRLVEGMSANGLLPKARETFSRIADHYPFPLAAVYARRMIAGAELGQAFQLHEGLRDIGAAVIRYVAVVAAAHYRARCRMGTAPDTFTEGAISQLARPQPDTWVALAHTALGLYPDSDDACIQSLYAFFFDRKHRDDAMGRAAGKLQGWLGPAGLKLPPFSGGDLFELLAKYRVHPQGWGTDGAVLPVEEYRQRGTVLAEALDAALAELECLLQFPLLGVAPESGAGRGADRIVALGAMGREIAPATETIRTGKALTANHVYLCRPGSGGPEPWLDLFPLMTVRRCRACDRPTVDVLDGGGRTAVVWGSPACGHSDELSADERRSLEHFIANREEAPPSPGIAPYLAALREVLADGEISAAEREKLEFLAKMLKLPAECAAEMEQQVRDELERPILSRLRELLSQTHELTAEQRAALREIPDALQPSAERLAALEARVRRLTERYADAVREAATAAGGIPAGRAGLDALAAELDLSPEQTGRLEAGVCQELESRQQISETHDIPPPPAAEEAASPTEVVWRKETASPVTGVAVFGDPIRVLSAGPDGEAQVHDADGRLIYSEQLGGRPYRVLGARGLALLAGWDGQLAAFTEKELIWQVHLDSPIAALAAVPSGEQLFAGTWEGLLRSVDRTGRTRWSQRLADGIACVAASEGHVAAATYSGHLALVDLAGQVVWLRELPAAVTAVQFAAAGDELLLLRRDRTLTRLRIDDQRVLEEMTFEQALPAMSLSGDGRRLAIATGDGHVLVYALADKMTLRRDHALGALAATAGLLMNPDGRFLLVAASDGRLCFVDNQANRISFTGGDPAAGPIHALAAFPDSRAVICGCERALTLGRLARPRLSVSLKPLGALRKGTFTRAELRLANEGSREARAIRLDVDGPVDVRLDGVPKELPAGGTGATAAVSLEPRASGALPVTVRVRYQDTLDLEYEDGSRLLLDAGE